MVDLSFLFVKYWRICILLWTRPFGWFSIADNNRCWCTWLDHARPELRTKYPGNGKSGHRNTCYRCCPQCPGAVQDSSAGMEKHLAARQRCGVFQQISPGFCE